MQQLHSDWQPPARTVLEQVLTAPASVAVFDADGTLWPHDAGDAFFHYLLRGNHLPRYESASYDDTHQHPVWIEYLHRCALNTLDGYYYIAQVMADLREAQLQELAADFVARELQGQVFAAQKHLFQALEQAGHEVWIVSASNRWLIEAAAPLLELSPARVCAMDSELEAGRLSDRPRGPIVQGVGKVEIIQQRIQKRPLLAMGNSHGDAAMLQYAEHAVVIDSEHRSEAWLAYLKLQGWPLQHLETLTSCFRPA